MYDLNTYCLEALVCEERMSACVRARMVRSQQLLQPVRRHHETCQRLGFARPLFPSYQYEDRLRFACTATEMASERYLRLSRVVIGMQSSQKIT